MNVLINSQHSANAKNTAGGAQNVLDVEYRHGADGARRSSAWQKNTSQTNAYQKNAYRTNSYNNAAGAGSTNAGAILLDIADKVMDNEAYKGHGLTADDIMQQVQNMDLAAQKDFMIVMSSCVSGEDLKKMQEDGFNPGALDAETYVSIVDQIKVTLLNAGVEIAGYNDHIDENKIKEVLGDSANIGDIEKSLEERFAEKLIENDMPVTDENIDRLKNAYNEASAIGSLSDNAKKYLITNRKAPTIDNLYKAQYTEGATPDTRQSTGYYSDGMGHIVKKADDISWESIDPQIERIVRESAEDESQIDGLMSNARWLVKSGIELNRQNLLYISDLNEINTPLNDNDVINICIKALKSGKNPSNALVTGERDVHEAIADIEKKIDAISGEAVLESVNEGERLTINSLYAKQKQLDGYNGKSGEGEAKSDAKNNVFQNKNAASNINPDTKINSNTKINTDTNSEVKADSEINANKNSGAADYEAAKALRQLEEIRLMMTTKAARSLIRSGLDIETMGLGKLVESLRSEENRLKMAMFGADNPSEAESREALYDETLQKKSELASMPAAVLGRMAGTKNSYTISRLYEDGKALSGSGADLTQGKADAHNNAGNNTDNGAGSNAGNNPNNSNTGNNVSGYQKANESYETLMTAPRADLGDSIKKAFGNVDDILEDFGLELTSANRRAVRILGYNSMDITDENIEAVKEADLMVNSVISKMTPAVVLDMIRAQQNPLEMTFEELDEYLNTMDSAKLNDAQRYSRFLQKLDKSDSITKEEREAYIGIYRMFHQIEKSDGAVIGSIISTGRPMNFRNMLSAVRSAKNKNMDYRIDDGFGRLEKLILNTKAIDAQINTAYEDSSKENLEFDNMESDNLKSDNLNPNALASENAADDSYANRDKEHYYAQLSADINDELAYSAELSKLKEAGISGETTIEGFADKIKATEMSDKSAKEALDAQILKEEEQELRESISNAVSDKKLEESVLQALIDYDQPVSIDNVEAAKMLILNRGYLFGQLFGRNDSNITKTPGNNKTSDNNISDNNISDNKVSDNKTNQDISADNMQASELSSSESAILEKAQSFVDSLTDSRSAADSYREIIDEASKRVDEMIYQRDVGHIDIKAAKALYKGLSLAKSLSREENYEIPMELGGEITSVNLKIYHNASSTGKVAVSMETKALGKVAAELSVIGNSISGMIVYDSRQGMEAVEGIKDSVTAALKEYAGSSDAMKDMNISLSLVHSKELDLNLFGADREPEENGVKLPTGELYMTARALMKSIMGYKY